MLGKNLILISNCIAYILPGYIALGEDLQCIFLWIVGLWWPGLIMTEVIWDYLTIQKTSGNKFVVIPAGWLP